MRRNHANGTGFDGVPPAPVLTAIGGRSIDQSVALGVTLTSPRRIMRRPDLAFQRIGLVSLALRPWTLKCSGSEGVERHRLPRHAHPTATPGLRVPGLEAAMVFVGLASASFGFAPP